MASLSSNLRLATSLLLSLFLLFSCGSASLAAATESHSCPTGQVYLNSFTLTVTPSGSTTTFDLSSDLSPAYSPSGPTFFYTVDRGADFSTGTIDFTPTSFSAGATFRIRFNHGNYINATAGQEVTADLIAGTDLIEFDVIQPPCAGTDIQEYSITIYQTGPPLPPPVVPPVHSTGAAVAPPPPPPTPSCSTGQVFLNSFTLTLTPSGSNEVFDLTSDVTPAFSPSGPTFFYVINRGENIATGTLVFTPVNFSAGATFRIRFNHGNYIYAITGQEVTADLIAGTDLIEFDVIQPPCAGTDIQEYSITIYQTGPPLPPPVVPPVPSTGAGVVSTPPPTPCAYTQVYLNTFSLFITPSGSNVQIDFLPYITPTYSPSGPEFFYVIERGSDLPTGTITFTPIDFTAGSTFRIRFNHGNYVYATEGQAVTGELIEGSDLIEFDVIQAPCAGTDIQEYSITLYQNGTSKIPSLPPVITPTQILPPPSPSSVPPLPTPIPSPASQGSPAPELSPGCPAITFTYSVAANGNGAGVEITFTNTAATATVAWVDFHVSINAALVAGSASVSAPQFNYRMTQSSATVFTLNFPTGLDDVQLNAVDYINFFFTYCSMTADGTKTDCNTGVFNYNHLPASSTQSLPPPVAADVVVTKCPVNFTQFVSVDTSVNVTNSPGAVSFSWFVDADIVISWVDIHVTITSSTVNGQFNYRMFQSAISATSAAQFQGSFVPPAIFFTTMPGTDGVSIPTDASVSYFFTYCVKEAMIDCNSQSFSFNFNRTAAASGTPSTGALVIGGGGVCPAINYSPSFYRPSDHPELLTVTFTNVSPNHSVAWVDLHVTINTALLPDGRGAYSPQYNYRMHQVSENTFNYTFPGIDGISVPQSSYIDYFFTYCSMTSDGVKTDCNTLTGTFGASAAVASISASSKAAADSNSNSNTNSNANPSSSTTSSSSSSNTNSNTNTNTNTNTNYPSSSSSSSSNPNANSNSNANVAYNAAGKAQADGLTLSLVAAVLSALVMAL